MRIAFTSDLHVDITPANLKILPYLAEELCRLEPDAVVVAGDIANSLAGWESALAHFSEIRVPKLIIPGNHDVWLESKRALKRKQDSAWKYRVALPECAGKFGFHYLPGQPFVLGGIGFAGSLGWYDYTLRDRRLDTVLSETDYIRGQL
jgi:3',5'-cyclic AMP phosphodiesterase CpdA